VIILDNTFSWQSFILTLFLNIDNGSEMAKLEFGEIPTSRQSTEVRIKITHTSPLHLKNNQLSDGGCTVKPGCGLDPF
jgi:hypothetical protein